MSLIETAIITVRKIFDFRGQLGQGFVIVWIHQSYKRSRYFAPFVRDWTDADFLDRGMRADDSLKFGGRYLKTGHLARLY